MKVAIEKIMILERIRKEITRIDELAADITKNGLINAVSLKRQNSELSAALDAAHTRIREMEA